MAFWPNFRRLWLKTNPFFGEPNWGHAIAVPLIGLYYLYTNRTQLLTARSKPSWFGLVFLFLGLAIWEYGIWPAKNDFISDFGIVVTLFGVVALICGWGVMKIAWFPIAFLACAIPWSNLLYAHIAWPLQLAAARVAVFTLQVAGVNAYDNGATKIFIGGFGLGDPVRTLNVAEACAGLRSLMTFVSVAAAVGFLSGRPLWQKIVITLSAVPIAVFCNVVRIAGQGFLDLWSREMSEGFAHQFVGMLMLAPAFFLIMGVGWLLDNLFIEEADKDANRKKVVSARTQAIGRTASAANVARPAQQDRQTVTSAAEGK
ncbi:MAG TPA: exosortase/archaeosortase family protein [Tepidisphaeraceae bacterium]|jgi:exosortase|nr:exosortase/archaeosortase family protein [Tepidisphaeraceae bacterium]